LFRSTPTNSMVRRKGKAKETHQGSVGLNISPPEPEHQQEFRFNKAGFRSLATTMIKVPPNQDHERDIVHGFGVLILAASSWCQLPLR